MSATRRGYMICLFARIIIFIIGLFMCKDAQNFEILEGNNFFKEFDILHLLWVVWVCDMIYQILPIKNKVALGSQKLFVNRFKPILEKINYEALKKIDINRMKHGYDVVFSTWGHEYEPGMHNIKK